MNRLGDIFDVYLIYSSQCSRINDGAGLRGLSVLTSYSLELLEQGQPFNRLAEDNMLSVKPVAINEGEEELRSVCVWSSVGHGKYRSLVLEWEALILFKNWREFFTGNFSPKIDFPPVPFPLVKSPPWAMKLGITLWNLDPLYP